MKNIFLKSLVIVFILHSCTKQKEQVFISNYNISVDSSSTIDTYLSLIHLKNDSIFSYNSLAPGFTPHFLGKLKHNKFETKTNGLNLDYFNDSLKLYDRGFIFHFKELKEKTTSSVSINSDYFVGKKFMASTKFGNQLIHFMDEKRGGNLTYDYNFEWDIIEFEGYSFLLSVSDIEIAPLFIKNITLDTIYTQLFTKDEVLDIIFTEFNEM